MGEMQLNRIFIEVAIVLWKVVLSPVCVLHSLHFKCADMYQWRLSRAHLQGVISHLSVRMDDPNNSFQRLESDLWT